MLKDRHEDTPDRVGEGIEIDAGDVETVEESDEKAAPTADPFYGVALDVGAQLIDVLRNHPTCDWFQKALSALICNPVRCREALVHAHEGLAIARQRRGKLIEQTPSELTPKRLRANRPVERAALADTLRDKTEAAYQRGGDQMEKRPQLMTEWAVFCLRPAALGRIVALRDCSPGIPDPHRHATRIAQLLIRTQWSEVSRRRSAGGLC